MANLGRALKAGVKGFLQANAPGRYEAAGKKIKCSHCGHDFFDEHEALLNTTGATLVRLDWLDTSGTALVCEKCGLVQWFVKRPERA